MSGPLALQGRCTESCAMRSRLSALAMLLPFMAWSHCYQHPVCTVLRAHSTHGRRGRGGTCACCTTALRRLAEWVGRHAACVVVNTSMRSVSPACAQCRVSAPSGQIHAVNKARSTSRFSHLAACTSGCWRSAEAHKLARTSMWRRLRSGPCKWPQLEIGAPLTEPERKLPCIACTIYYTNTTPLACARGVPRAGGERMSDYCDACASRHQVPPRTRL